MTQPGEQAPEAEAAEAEPAQEPGQMSERTAKVVLLAVAMGAIWGIVAVLPETAYYVAGILTCRGWQTARDWISRRQGSSGDGPGAIEAADVVEALHQVAAPNVFLADLAAELGVAKDEARALLEKHGIRVRRAVRNGDDTGVGVHRDDLPPLPQAPSTEPETSVDLGKPTNQREAIGLAGVIVKDGSEATRRHRIR